MATIKVEHNAIYWVSIILTVLFAWLIFPYKWITRALFNRKKAKAMRKARKMSEQTGATIYVVQWHDTFFIGKRNELRQIINQYYAKRIHKRYSHKLDVDFRNAVVASYKHGERCWNDMNGKHDNGTAE